MNDILSDVASVSDKSKLSADHFFVFNSKYRLQAQKARSCHKQHLQVSSSKFCKITLQIYECGKKILKSLRSIDKKNLSTHLCKSFNVKNLKISLSSLLPAFSNCLCFVFGWSFDQVRLPIAVLIHILMARLFEV